MNRKHEFKTLINEEDIIKVWLTGRLARPEKNLEPLDTPLRRCHLSSLRLQTKISFEINGRSQDQQTATSKWNHKSESKSKT